MTEACEGCYLYAYDDKGELDDNGRPLPFEEGDELVGTLTIGHGHTGPDVVPGMRITQEKADALYLEDVEEAEDGVKSCVTVPLKQSEFDACCDQVFNTGIGKFKSSTMLKRINAENYEGAGEAILMWYKTKGMEYGMLRRCAARYALFMGLPWDAAYNFVTKGMTWLMLENSLSIKKAASDLLEVAERQRDNETKAFATAMKKESAPIKEAPPVSIPDKGPAEPRERIVIEKIEEVKPEIKTVNTPEPSKPPEFSMSSIPYGNVDTTADPKDALKSKRIWGLFIMIASRISFPFVGSITALNTVTQDPILFDAAAGGLAMGAIWLIDAGGQYLHKWGKDSATTLIK